MSKTTEEPDQVENLDVDSASDSESDLEVESESEESVSESDSEEDLEEAEMHANDPFIIDPEEIIIADFPGLVCDADGFC